MPTHTRPGVMSLLGDGRGNNMAAYEKGSLPPVMCRDGLVVLLSLPGRPTQLLPCALPSCSVVSLPPFPTYDLCFVSSGISLFPGWDRMGQGLGLAGW